MSENLKDFLSAYLEWANAGAPKYKAISRGVGLCSNYEWWLVDRGISYAQAGDECDELKGLLVADGLNREYPFGGASRYSDDLIDRTQHLNQDRLAWVRSKVEQHAVV